MLLLVLFGSISAEASVALADSLTVASYDSETDEIFLEAAAMILLFNGFKSESEESNPSKCCLSLSPND